MLEKGQLRGPALVKVFGWYDNETSGATPAGWPTSPRSSGHSCKTTQRNARRTVMTTQPIIAGVDGSEESLGAAEWAAREATARKTALRIVSSQALLPRMSLDPAGRETVAGVIYNATRDALASAAERAVELEPGLAIDTGPPRR
jgi:hypothetical protein